MNPSTVLPKGGLYLITPDDAVSENFLARVLPLLDSRIAMLQYRNKLASERQMHEQASLLQRHCRESGIVFIVNDDIELARESGADGVHLGEHDADIPMARRLLGPDAIIGASCYDDLQLASNAASQGADYIAFGAVYPSATKPGARHAGLELFSQAKPLALPMVAIGGITSDNARQTIAAGADFLAVIGAVFDAAEPAREIDKFTSCFL